MKRIVSLLMIAFFVVGCSKGPSQLSFDKIEGLPLDEQVNAIVENTKLVEDHEIIVDDNSVAIIYPAEFISDDRLTLDKSKESFPSVAMVFAEHLKVLDVDEIVITSYDPSTELTKVSALFTSETINDLNFEKWKDDKKDNPNRFYTRHADAYLIRGNVWEKLSEEKQDLIKRDSRDSDSQFWDYYGKYVE